MAGAQSPGAPDGGEHASDTCSYRLRNSGGGDAGQQTGHLRLNVRLYPLPKRAVAGHQTSFAQAYDFLVEAIASSQGSVGVDAGQLFEVLVHYKVPTGSNDHPASDSDRPMTDVRNSWAGRATMGHGFTAALAPLLNRSRWTR
jgi:hypothetical protein